MSKTESKDQPQKSQEPQKHSPLPWKVDVRVGCVAVYPESLPADQTQCLDGSEEEIILYKSNRAVWDDKSKGTWHWAMSPQDVANAELIVRAVNAHGYLLAACKGILQALEEEGMYPKTQAILRGAIAKAEGSK
jgi:hypothetical protein